MLWYIKTYRRALLLLEKWLDRLIINKPGNSVPVASATLATTFARAGQIELVDKMIAPFRTHRHIDEVIMGKFPHHTYTDIIIYLACMQWEFYSLFHGNFVHSNTPDKTDKQLY